MESPLIDVRIHTILEVDKDDISKNWKDLSTIR